MRTQGMADDWLAGIVLRQKVLQLISPTSFEYQSNAFYFTARQK